MKSFALFIALSFITSACSLIEWKDRILGAIVEQVPLSFEIAIGDQLLPSVLPPEMVLNDPKALAQLSELLQPVLKKNLQPPIKLHISKDDNLNAFAVPGGHLIFNRGMLLAAGTPDEILGVAAHEIAHATERHSMRSMVQGLGIFAIVTFFFGDLNGLAAYLLDQGQLLLQKGFSREQEKAADAKGFEYLVGAGMDPRGMIRFFERIKEKGQGANSRIESFFSTHPMTGDRIEVLEQRFNALPDARRKSLKNSPYDLKDLQSLL